MASSPASGAPSAGFLLLTLFSRIETHHDDDEAASTPPEPCRGAAVIRAERAAEPGSTARDEAGPRTRCRACDAGIPGGTARRHRQCRTSARAPSGPRGQRREDCQDTREEGLIDASYGWRRT